jgi:hypothetical protein
MKISQAASRPSALRCRIRIELESPAGEELLQLQLEKEMAPVSGRQGCGSLSRSVGDFLRGEVAAELHDRVFDLDTASDPQAGKFEAEFARRCDATDRIVSSLRWLNPPGPTDAETRWMQGMTEVFMARRQNDLLMQHRLGDREPA